MRNKRGGNFGANEIRAPPKEGSDWCGGDCESKEDPLGQLGVEVHLSKSIAINFSKIQ